MQYAEGKFSPRTIWKWLLRVMQGALVGCGAILPGVSGGVLCVSFGLYRPMMALFAHPIRNFNENMPLLLPAGIGWAVGFFGFAKLISSLFSADSTLAICLFIGLIAGTFPGLYHQAGKQGRSNRNLLAMALSFAVILASYWLIDRAASMHIRPNVFWYGFCGVLWGLSLVIPGMTSASTLIFLGLFEPMTAGIAAMDPTVVVPMILGVAVTVGLMARLVNGMFERHYAMSFHVVLGIVMASMVVILPTEFMGVREALYGALCGIAGFLAAFWLDRRSSR